MFLLSFIVFLVVLVVGVARLVVAIEDNAKHLVATNSINRLLRIPPGRFVRHYDKKDRIRILRKELGLGRDVGWRRVDESGLCTSPWLPQGTSPSCSTTEAPRGSSGFCLQEGWIAC